MNIKLVLWFSPYFPVKVLSKYEICICVESVTLSISAYV